MKRWLAALLIALLLGTAALAEAADDFDFFFDDEGYTGEWVGVDALNMEFCLPDGWTEIAPDGGAAYSAISGDAAATLDIRLEAEGIDDLSDWAAANVTDYVEDEAGLYDALVLEPDANRIGVAILFGDGQLVTFRFTRATEEDMPREYALQIAGSASENWLEATFEDLDDDAFRAELDAAFAGDEG